MKQFINKTIFTSFPLILLLLTVNYWGDAARIFDTEYKYEKQISKIILNGNFATNISNYDERIFQKELIVKMTNSPELLVIGSSRTMLIHSGYFPKKKFFNNSVSGASIEDLIALFEIYKERGLFPKKIIIGIDPWLFNENNEQIRWETLSYYYNKYHNKENKNRAFPFNELISLSYFQSSLKTSQVEQPISTKIKYNKTNTKLIDGSLTYGEEFRNASQIEINSKISNYISEDDIYGLKNFDAISTEILNEFKTFILTLKKQNISVEFFLAPYAPLVFKEVSKKHPNVENTENFILKFAKDNEIKIYGSFNPLNLEFDKTYFYDGMHCKEKGIKKILESNN